LIDKNIELEINNLENILKELKIISNDRIINASDEIKEIENRINELQKEMYKNLTAWDRVMIARTPNRPTALDYIENIFDEFIELHGDRGLKDDKSIVCGIGSLNGISYTIIGEQKGRTTKENIERNFGMPNPEAYRKSLRFMKQAEKFNRPIITFVDTKGAYPGIGAEERGQGEAIARNLLEMSLIKVPILVIIIGEGSSGGALALGVGDRVIMLENAIYSILSPEGYASILWKDSTKAVEAAEIMKLTANDLLELKVIDKILKEPFGGAHKDKTWMVASIKQEILDSMNELMKMDKETLLNSRYIKFRNMGEYKEVI
jgi:acetyl-CoA carboxylase carboxyl transferase subunit alpha